jgi:hypothetical protein
MSTVANLVNDKPEYLLDRHKFLSNKCTDVCSEQKDKNGLMEDYRWAEAAAAVAAAVLPAAAAAANNQNALAPVW